MASAGEREDGHGREHCGACFAGLVGEEAARFSEEGHAEGLRETRGREAAD